MKCEIYCRRFVATVNKDTVSMGKIVFALKYKVILANSAFPEN